MELAKIQKFLKNLHKFDHRKDNDDIFYDLMEKTKKLEPLILKTGSELDVGLANHLIDIIQLCNIFDIDLEKTLIEKLNYNT